MLAPPSLWPNHCPAPANPRVTSCDSPRVVAPSPLGTNPMWSPSTAWRPPPQAAVTSLTPAPSAPTFHLTPCCLVFGDDHSSRVVSEPQQPLLPPAAVVLPVWEPIAHCTRSVLQPHLLSLLQGGGIMTAPNTASLQPNPLALQPWQWGLRGSVPCIT